MKLRYIVESKFSKTFTVTKKVINEIKAEEEVVKLMAKNKKAGYLKHSDFLLYDEDDNIIQRFKP